MSIVEDLKSKFIKKPDDNVAWRAIPNSSQTLFLLSCQINPQTGRAYIPELLISSGRGSGKTETSLVGSLTGINKGWNEHYVCVFFRKEIKSLRDLIKKSHKIIPKAFPEATYNKTERCWTFPRGEKIYFDFMSCMKDYDDKWHGQEIGGGIFWEELSTYQDITLYEAMKSCLRHSFQPTEEQPHGPPMMVRANTNPYGIGRGWVKEYFVDPAPEGTIIFDDDGEPWKMHIFGSVFENIYITRDYVKKFLQKIADPVLRAAWLYGDWHAVDYSAIFGGLWSKHLEIDPFDIPSNWDVHRSFDFGQSSPFATVWTAEANGEEVIMPDGSVFCPPAGSIIVCAEDYGTAENSRGEQVKRNEGLYLSARPIARRIKEKEDGLYEGILKNVIIQPGPADNQIYNGERVDGGKAMSIGAEMEEEGIDFIKSDKSKGSRATSAQLMIERLDATRQQDPERPHIYFFKTCRYCIKFLPELHRCEKKPEEVGKSPDDHLWDALAYRLTMRGGAEEFEGNAFF